MNLFKSLTTTARKPMNLLGYDIVLHKPGINVNYKRLTRFGYLSKLYSQIESLEGDIVECGIGRGISLYMLSCLVYAERKGRCLWGFDSFEGFPDPTLEDESSRTPRKGDWNVTTQEKVRSLISSDPGIDSRFVEQNLKLVEGYFEDTVYKHHIDKIAFLHLDVDLYNSYKVTLEQFWPQVVPGGIVLFDEYKEPTSLEKFPGASKAINEFFNQYNLVDQIRYDKKAGKYYIIKPD